MSWTLSQRAQKLTSSAIREILKVTERPEVISFAGGLPSPDTFPVERLREKRPTAVLTRHAVAGAAVRPDRRLRAAARMDRDALFVGPGAHRSARTVLMVTTGSQQGLDLLGKVLIDAGSRVLVETPTYLGRAAGVLGVPSRTSCRSTSDEHGLVPSALRRSCRKARASCTCCRTSRTRPAAACRSSAAPRAGANPAQATAVPLIVEDDPYGALSYTGEPLPTHADDDSRPGVSTWARSRRCSRRASASAT